MCYYWHRLNAASILLLSSYFAEGITNISSMQNVTSWALSYNRIPDHTEEYNTIASFGEQKSHEITLNIHKSNNNGHMTLPTNMTTSNYTRELSVAEQAKSYLLYRAGVGIHTYWLPVLVPVGFVGNILSILVMTSNQNIKISCCVYMSILAIVDNIMLCLATNFWFVTTGYPRNRYLWDC